MIKFRTLSLLLLLLGSPAAVPQGTDREQPESASMLQLIATPERFDGKRVSVIGFLVLGWEGSFVYSHQDDYKNGIVQNALRIRPTVTMTRDKAALNGKYVQVVGVFESHASSNGPPPKGGITAIAGCKLWSDPDHPFIEKIREMPGVSRDH